MNTQKIEDQAVICVLHSIVTLNFLSFELSFFIVCNVYEDVWVYRDKIEIHFIELLLVLHHLFAFISNEHNNFFSTRENEHYYL
jgi:hypothetical protein